MLQPGGIDRGSEIYLRRGEGPAGGGCSAAAGVGGHWRLVRPALLPEPVVRHREGNARSAWFRADRAGSGSARPRDMGSSTGPHMNQACRKHEPESG